MKQQKLYNTGIVAGMALSAMLSVSTVQAAANNPEIMDIFVALEYVPDIAPNIFLELDDSRSMREPIWYDPNTQYIVPPDPNGWNAGTKQFNPLPTPATGSGFASVSTNDGHLSTCAGGSVADGTSHYFAGGRSTGATFPASSRFYDFNRLVPFASNTFESSFTIGNFHYKFINQGTFRQINGNLFLMPIYNRYTLTDIASDQTSQNCLNYKAFYSSRMLTLKSALAVSLTSQPGNYSLDFDFINNDALDTIDLKNMSRYGDYNTNMGSFLRGLYSEDSFGGTPVLQQTSDLFTKVRAASVVADDTNIFLDDGEDYSAEKLLYCKQNYAILLSDGKYNEGNANTVLTGNADTNIDSITRNFSLFPSTVTDKQVKEGATAVSETFNGAWAVKGQRIISGGGSNSQYQFNRRLYPALTDVVFRAWADDLSTSLPDQIARSWKKADETLKDSNNIDAILPEFWNPENDPANWQHISTFTIGLGLGTEYTDEFMANVINGVVPSGSPYTSSGWSGITSNTSGDDFVRAGYVGRGGFSRADSAQDLLDTFNRIFEKISDRSHTQAVSSAATSASQVTTKTTNILFTTGTNSKDWTGKLTGNWMYSGIAEPKDADGNPIPGRPTDGPKCFGTVPSGAFAGQLCTIAHWSAEEKMKSEEGLRDIFSIADKDNTGLSGSAVAGTKGTSFKYADMSAAQKAFFDDMLFDNGNAAGIRSVNAGDEALLVNFLRGDNALASNNDIRKRKDGLSGGVPLGDFGRGSPAYMGPPNEKVWNESSPILANHLPNRNYVFAGANDGMLHAFDATTGEEVFAFVPNEVYPNFDQLIKKDAKHTAFVDGNPSVQDIVDTNGENKTILVSGMGRGGKGLFALDITSPSTFAKENVLWELQDDRIGHIYGKPSIIRVEGNYAGEDNRWVIVVGTGYNNIKPDDTSYVQTSGVMVIDPMTGEILQYLQLPDAEGVGEIAWLDHQKRKDPRTVSEYLGSDGTGANENSLYGEADRGYVGDLNGNLWVLDFSYNRHIYDSGNVTQTVLGGDNELRSAVYAGTTLAGKTNNLELLKPGFSDAAKTSGAQAPLFVATDKHGRRQPISTKPMIVKHPINRGYMVYFGTGELFRVKPMNENTINSMYGIWDDYGNNYSDYGYNETQTSSQMTDNNKTRDRYYLTEYRWKSATTTFEGSSDGVHVRVSDTGAGAIAIKSPITWANSQGSPDSGKVLPSAYTESSDVPSSGWVINTGKNSALGQFERIFQSPYSVINSDGQEGVSFLMSTLIDAANPCDAESVSSTWNMTFRTDSVDGPLAPFSEAVVDLDRDGNIDGNGADDDVANPNGGGKLTPMGGIPVSTGSINGIDGVGYVPTAVQSLNTAPLSNKGGCNGLLRSYKVVVDENSTANTSLGNVSEVNICIPQPMSSWSEIE